MKGYKVFNSDWTCRGFQFEVGKIFEEDVEPKCCDRGFHFCTNAADCFKYYNFDIKNKVAEIEALGVIDTEGDDSKHCTNKIHIIRELTWNEVLELVNTGKSCTGFCNSGDCNSGNRNSGNRNSGNRNSGDWNSGDCNSGDWNKTNYSNGCFNTTEPKIYLFNKPSNWTYSDWLSSDARYLLNNIPKDVTKWVWSENMTDEEKSKHPEHEITGGYLKVLDEVGCGQVWWDSLPKCYRDIIKALPNFDAEIFEQCTGIKVGNTE